MADYQSLGRVFTVNRCASSPACDMSVWRNRQTRSAKDAMSQGVEVQVLSWTPLFSRSKQKRDATPFGAKYASLAQLDSSNRLLSGRSLVRVQHGVPFDGIAELA